MTVKELLEQLTKVIEENPECIDRQVKFLPYDGDDYSINAAVWDPTYNATFLTER